MDNEGTYIGLTEGSFKERLSDYRTSFKYEQYKNKSKLSSFIWETKNKRQNFEIKWSVIRRSTPYKDGSIKCTLCLWEKFHLMIDDKASYWMNRLNWSLNVDTLINFFLKNYKSRRRGRGRGRGRGRWCFFSWYILVFFLYYHVCPLITCYFILD